MLILGSYYCEGVGVRYWVTSLYVRCCKHRDARDRHNLQGQLINCSKSSLRQDKPAFALGNV